MGRQPDLLPAAVRASRISARMWIAATAGLGAAALAFAGTYPAFDGGRLRLVLGLTSLPFAAAVVASATSAKSGKKAFGAAVLYSTLLGVASTVIPSVLIGRHENIVALAATFGTIFGSITGVCYGVVLGIAASLGHKHVQLGTQDGADRTARAGGLWLMATSSFAFAVSLLYLGSRSEATFSFGEEHLVPPLVPSCFAIATVVFGGLLVLRASLRLRARAAWIARVREGKEPKFRVRPADLRDPVAHLPRLADGHTVIEWCPEGFDSAYRSAASHEAVAVVADVRR